MSLLQGVLRSTTLDRNRFDNGGDHEDGSDSDNEFVNVVSIPGTPIRSRAASRAPSPERATYSSNSRHNGSKPTSRPKIRSIDPLRILPTEISQRIFGLLRIADLAKCARVSKKWCRSQTINYVWFQHYRKDNFHDDSLPPGKWTRRESKQNWRILHLSTVSTRNSDYSTTSSASISRSGYQTPREVREEKWKQEAEVVSRPGKLEMRSMYKELGGRKSKAKTKLGGSGGARDKGGWDGGQDFEAPW